MIAEKRKLFFLHFACALTPTHLYDQQRHRCFSGKQDKHLPILYDSMLDFQAVRGSSRNPFDKQG